MTCPFIDSNNPHCDSHLNMQNLDDAYELCNHHYQLCPLYLRLIKAPVEMVSTGINQGQTEKQL